MGRLKNKIALITGASRGIGAETAKLFVEEGAKVILTDILDDLGQSLADSLGKNAYYYHLDVSQENDWEKISDVIFEEFSHIDILFNNAGIIGIDESYGPQDPENISHESWDYVHQVNLNGTLYGCKYAIKWMKEKGGSIINMSSRSGIVGIPSAAAYASSKAAVRNHTKTVALYCTDKKYNIRCNSIHPGAILTPLWDAMLSENPEEKKETIKSIEDGIPIGHMGRPIDVAYAVVYLGSDESKYITGIELNIDGGILAGSSAAPKK